VHQVNEDLPLTQRVIAASNDTTIVQEIATDQALVTLPSEALVDEIAGRPLFSASRRPSIVAPAVVDVPAKPVDQSLTWVLVGTMLAGETPIALFRHPEEGLIRLRKGQSMDDWKVMAIDSASVNLGQGERTETLSLQYDLIDPADRTQAAPTQPISNLAAGIDGEEQDKAETHQD